MLDNEILIGNKPLMNYVTAILTQLKEQKTIIIMARGAAIKKAIDAVEITTKQFYKHPTTTTITTNSTTLINENNVKQTVSSIKIILNKQHRSN